MTASLSASLDLRYTHTRLVQSHHHIILLRIARRAVKDEKKGWPELPSRRRTRACQRFGREIYQRQTSKGEFHRCAMANLSNPAPLRDRDSLQGKYEEKKKKEISEQNARYLYLPRGASVHEKLQATSAR